MKKVQWIVMKADEEIIRVTTKRLAEVIASDIGGYVNKYTVECGK
jgi:hypothetical protein